MGAKLYLAETSASKARRKRGELMRLKNWVIRRLSGFPRRALLPIIRPGNWAFDFPPSRVKADFLKIPLGSEGFLDDFSDFCILEVTPRLAQSAWH
ncbi:hypothetical protein MRX96_031130 [Rhipicephalus microplus]